MNTVLEITAPVFGIALIGYFTTRFGFFSASAGEGLAKFVFNFAVPALLVRTFANASLPDAAPLEYLLAYYLPTVIIYLVGMVIAAKFFQRPLEGQVITGFSFSYGNGLLLGLPLVLLAFDETKALPYFILLSVHALILFTITTVLLEYSRHQGEGGVKMLINTIVGLIKNPILVAIVLGVSLNFLDIPLTGTADTITRYFQQAVTACSLFALGASMTKYRIAGRLAQSAVVILVKNCLLPLSVYLSCTLLFSLPAEWVFIAVLLAAQPTGVNVYIFAERYQTGQALATTSVFLSTAFSLLSIPVILYIHQLGWF